METGKRRQQLALLRDGLGRMLASGVWADRLSADHLAGLGDLSDLATL
ncbi:MAG: hypothetical protein ACI8RZ_006396, partial [Myxococcota bacterium]